MASNIEWLKDKKTGKRGEVWNPTIGCKHKTEGCRNCYAERWAVRLLAMGRQEEEAKTDEH